MPGFLSVRPQDWATAEPTVAGGTFIFVAENGIDRLNRDTSTWEYPDVSAIDTVWMGVVASGSHVWAGSFAGKLLHSSDSMGTWEEVSPPQPGWPVLALQTDGVNVTITQWDGAGSEFTVPANALIAIRPLDGSGSWTTMVSASSTQLVSAESAGAYLWYGQYDPVDDGVDAVYRTPLTPGSGTNVDIDLRYASRIRIVQDDPTIAYGCSYGDVTPAQGKVWRMVLGSTTNITPSVGSGNSLTGFPDVASNHDDTVLLAWYQDNNVSSNRTLYRSTDQGGSWTVVVSDSGISAPDFGHNNGIAWSASDPNLVVLGMDTPILLSTDAGLTWSPLPDLGGGTRGLAVP